MQTFVLVHPTLNHEIDRFVSGKLFREIAPKIRAKVPITAYLLPSGEANFSPFFIRPRKCDIKVIDNTTKSFSHYPDDRLVNSAEIALTYGIRMYTHLKYRDFLPALEALEELEKKVKERGLQEGDSVILGGTTFGACVGYVAKYLHNRGYRVLLPFSLTDFDNHMFSLISCFMWKGGEKRLDNFTKDLHLNFIELFSNYSKGWRGKNGIKEVYIFKKINYEYLKANATEISEHPLYQFIKNEPELVDDFYERMYDFLEKAAKKNKIRISYIEWTKLIE